MRSVNCRTPSTAGRWRWTRTTRRRPTHRRRDPRDSPRWNDARRLGGGSGLGAGAGGGGMAAQPRDHSTELARVELHPTTGPARTDGRWQGRAARVCGPERTGLAAVARRSAGNRPAPGSPFVPRPGSAALRHRTRVLRPAGTVRLRTDCLDGRGLGGELAQSVVGAGTASARGLRPGFHVERLVCSRFTSRCGMSELHRSSRHHSGKASRYRQSQLVRERHRMSDEIRLELAGEMRGLPGTFAS